MSQFFVPSTTCSMKSCFCINQSLVVTTPPGLSTLYHSLNKSAFSLVEKNWMKKSVSIQSKFSPANGMCKASPSTKEIRAGSISWQVSRKREDWLTAYVDISRTSMLDTLLRFITKRVKVTVV